MYYQRDPGDLRAQLEEYRAAAPDPGPYVQVLHVGLDEDPTAPPERVHQGFAAGSEWLRGHVADLRDAGADHVIVNLRATGAERDTRTVLEQFADEVLAELSGTPP